MNWFVENKEKLNINKIKAFYKTEKYKKTKTYNTQLGSDFQPKKIVHGFNV